MARVFGPRTAGAGPWTRAASGLALFGSRREYPRMGFPGGESAGDSPESGYVWIVHPVERPASTRGESPSSRWSSGVGVNYDPLLKETLHAGFMGRIEGIA